MGSGLVDIIHKVHSEIKKEINTVTDSLWGDVDIDEVSDNPYAITPDIYFATCTEASINETEDGNKLRVVWTIAQPENEFDGMSVRESFHLAIPGVSFEGQPAETKKSIKKLKFRMRNALDLSESEIKSFSKSTLDSLFLGKEAYITIVNNDSEKNGEKVVYNNITRAMSKRVFEEQNDVSTAQTNSEFGL